VEDAVVLNTGVVAMRGHVVGGGLFKYFVISI